MGWKLAFSSSSRLKDLQKRNQSRDSFPIKATLLSDSCGIYQHLSTYGHRGTCHAAPRSFHQPPSFSLSLQHWLFIKGHLETPALKYSCTVKVNLKVLSIDWLGFLPVHDHGCCAASYSEAEQGYHQLLKSTHLYSQLMTRQVILRGTAGFVITPPSGTQPRPYSHQCILILMCLIMNIITLKLIPQ